MCEGAKKKFKQEVCPHGQLPKRCRLCKKKKRKAEEAKVLLSEQENKRRSRREVAAEQRRAAQIAARIVNRHRLAVQEALDGLPDLAPEDAAVVKQWCRKGVKVAFGGSSES